MRGLTAVLLLLSCGFAVAQTSSTATAPTKFDGQRAYQDLLQQCEFGPRLPGTDAHQKTRDYILKVLGENGFATSTQPFEAKSDLLGKTVAGVNLYGTYPKGKPVRYMLSAHYDTRPFADQDKDPDKVNKPVMGANDAASGVAVLLELARHIPQLNQSKATALVFLDLEDHGAPTNNEGFCKGSQYLAAHLPPELQFEAGVNLDMVGDADLRFRQERYSLSRYPDLTTKLWTIGGKLYPEIFVQEMGPPIYDDHIAFQKAGKPYIDVIDFEYPSWHTGDDTADKCSAESLQAIGDVMLQFIQN
jgi:hypothetical protein